MKLKDLFEATGKSVADLGIEYKGGNFNCYRKELTSLQGAPSHVDRDFYCSNNLLTSLEGAPSYVGIEFNCARNRLTSLAGAPSHVGVHFYCSDNELTSLAGAPSHVGGHFDCSNNELASLEGAPSHVSGNFYCSVNELTSLEGAPSRVGGHFYCSDNELTSFKDVHKYIAEIQGDFFGTENPIRSHVLGLLLIKGLQWVQLDNKQVEEILNRHLGKGRAGMLMAQEELIEAGLEEFAQL